MIHLYVVLYAAMTGLAIASCSSSSTNTKISTTDSIPADTGVSAAITPQAPVIVKTRREVPGSVFSCGYELSPEYPGGNRAMYEFIAANLRTPVEAKKAHVSGRVFVSFVVDVTGEVIDVSVLKGLGFGCDREAVRLVESMPKWKPGKQYDKPVRVKYNLPINFEAR